MGGMERKELWSLSERGGGEGACQTCDACEVEARRVAEGNEAGRGRGLCGTRRHACMHLKVG